jgi:anti-sigma factor RsiW
MKNHWHEQILRYVNGQASAEEVATLQAALNEDAQLRALYLDYINLDVALGAAAEAATIPESETARIATSPRSPAQSLPRYWYWLAAAATATCVVLVTILVLPIHRNATLTPPDVAAACSQTQESIARISVELPSVFPAWASPTASMLEQPPIPQWDHRS